MSVVVRSAEIYDIPAYTDLAGHFFTAGPFAGLVQFNPAKVADFLLTAIQNPAMGVWLAEERGRIVGICGATIYPVYFAPDHKAAQELWWWVEPEARGGGAGKALLDMVELWAREHGASITMMGALETHRIDAMTRVYARSGYTPVERIFYKGLHS